MRRFITLIFFILFLFIPTSCNEKSGEKADYYAVFTDDAEREIVLYEKPVKTAVLFSSHAEAVLLSGGSVDITVGESIERGFVSEDTPTVDDGAGKRINTELLISYAPDFVIGSYDIAAHRDAAELLMKNGIPMALFRIESFSDYERIMEILCGIFEREDLYRENVSRVKENIEQVLSSVPGGEKKKVLFIRCASSGKATKAKTKKESFVCAMLDEMNTCNIAENAPMLLDGLSIEEIILENPDSIFFSPMGDEEAARQYIMSVMQGEAWQALDAVKNERYIFLEKDLFQYKPNNRWDKAYEILAEFLYGEK